jgi:hypothetical protein
MCTSILIFRRIEIEARRGLIVSIVSYVSNVSLVSNVSIVLDVRGKIKRGAIMLFYKLTLQYAERTT